MLPIVQAMQLLSTAGYEPLGPLVAQREFPLLVKKQQVVSVAKLVNPDNVPVLQRLKQQPIPRMPRIEALLTATDCIVSVETLINGQTLVDRLATQGPFSPEMTVRVAQELLITLQALGQQQIVHRDLKLSNVMCYRDHYYLIDVNAARQYHAEQDSDTRLLGTSGFAAPGKLWLRPNGSTERSIFVRGRSKLFVDWSRAERAVRYNDTDTGFNMGPDYYEGHGPRPTATISKCDCNVSSVTWS
ncbi:Serine/threonine protein kinase [Lactiplantibacillus plantarum]|nr:hypothetical protein [Lactiplantibacillus plantarum]MCG0592399.1 Serine/threonine protein kinase [Lactiplantibacillus plantarum]MCG0664175.1 Serine/threonine protein kinase [Lactiplantibacillus plantarum]MCG0671161.1 Serine/threonine protein kinase [Lactiplantibacillus plantarum]MCG0812318.1 Serine/threonine protein kinase [Lactiplantibacillus plantarum]MCG0877579.1 Serine/threonine protein kinase [Lactiplantibacillus plantarum]